MSTVLESIRELLTAASIDFVEKEHEPTFTSEESARARGEELRHGGKAFLVKTDDVFRLFIVPADRKLDSAAVKREFGIKKTRFATAEELFDLTGLVPGSVPPFGRPILPLELFVDASIRDNPPHRLQCRLADQLDHHERGRLSAGRAAASICVFATLKSLRGRLLQRFANPTEQHLDGHRHQHHPHEPFDRDQSLGAENVPQAAGKVNDHGGHDPCQQQRDEPIAPAVWLAAHEQQLGGERRRPGDIGDGQRNDKWFAVHAFLHRCLRRREHHAQRDQKRE